MFHIIGGLVIVVIGAVITIKSGWFFQNFGPIPFFDKYLGTEGGSRFGYQLIGVLGCMIGFMIMTDLFGGLIMWIFGGMFAGFKRQ